MSCSARYYTWIVLFLMTISGANLFAQADVPILVLADGPESMEKSAGDTALIDGTEWSEAPIVQDGLTVHVLFKDAANTGFRDATLGEARRARLYDALRYVADTLNTGGELDVMVNLSEHDGSGALAQAGPLFVAKDGLTNGNVFNRLTTGTVPSPGYAEMVLTFDWGYSWHIGPGAPPSDALDLQSVAVHEITHCFGFISLMAADGSSRFSSISRNTYTVLDSLLAVQPSYMRLLGGTSTAPSFNGTPADLTENLVVFAGSEAYDVFGASPLMYCPGPFSSGSSLSHWVEDVVPGGTVMETRFSYGEARREYANVEIAALRDIGWDNADVPGLETCAIRSVTILQPSQGSIAGNASNQAQVNFRASVALEGPGDLCEDTGGTLRLEYFVDGVSRGVSGDEERQFPLDLTLPAGTHTVRVSATLTDLAEDPVETEKTFTITSAAMLDPVMAVNPADAEKDFGSLNEKDSADAVYTVKNIGGGKLTGAASLSGDSQFQFAGDSTYSLSPGAESNIIVHFAPDAQGSFAGELVFGGNGGSVTVALSGAGAKTGGLLNCAGGQNTAAPAGTADMLVAMLALLALAGRHRHRTVR